VNLILLIQNLLNTSTTVQCWDKTDIEFFNGGHTMKLQGTFKFLHKHLNWL